MDPVFYTHTHTHTHTQDITSRLIYCLDEADELYILQGTFSLSLDVMY
jgi:hypothetical protein